MTFNEKDPSKIIYRIEKLLNRDNTAIVGQLLPPRIGWKSFGIFLEWRHFRPGTPETDQFHAFGVLWEGIIWSIYVFPTPKLPVADELMQQLGLRRADGIPTMFIGQGQGKPARTSLFPVASKKLWTAENVHGHFTYKNDPQLGITAEQAEIVAINAELARWGQPPIS